MLTAVADQCMYGLVTHSEVDGKPAPAMKPTRFMSNSSMYTSRSLVGGVKMLHFTRLHSCMQFFGA